MKLPSPSVVMLTADRQIDRRILQQAQSLRANGWHVTLIAMPLDTPVASSSEPDVVRVGGDRGAARAREGLVLWAYRGIRNLIPMNGRMMRLAKQIAWRYLIDQEKFYQRLYGAAAMQFKPTVFMAHDLPMLAVARSAADACGARLVYDSHELYAEQEFSPYERKRWRDIERKHIYACDKVITVNPSVARELERTYELAEQVEVIYNAAPLDGRHPHRSGLLRKRMGLSDSAYILLMQGGLSAGRNLETLVRAMGKVQHPNIHLVFLGDGQLARHLKRTAIGLGLQGRVHFHEAVSQGELALYTSDADAGVIPYLATCKNNEYCTPNKLFEYVAAGLPVLASNLPEVHRIVHEYGFGMTTDFKSVESIAKGIDSFFSDAGRTAQWQEKAKSAQKELCWEHEEKKLISIFEKLY